MKLLLLSSFLALSAASMPEGSIYRSNAADSSARRLGGTTTQRGSAIEESKTSGGLRRRMNSKAGKGHQNRGRADKGEKADKSDSGNVDKHRKHDKGDKKKRGREHKAKEPMNAIESEAETFAEVVHKHFKEMELEHDDAPTEKLAKADKELEDDAEYSTFQPTVKVEQIHIAPTITTSTFATDMSSSTTSTADFASSTTSSANLSVSSSSTSSAFSSSTSSYLSSSSPTIESQLLSATFATMAVDDDYCPESCNNDFCQCITNEISSECLPILASECSAQSPCLTHYFFDDSVASVFCSSVTCLASGKTEAECRCEFVEDLCDMDAHLEFQCEQARCCNEAQDDGSREECFATTVAAPTFWESTSSTVATTSEEVSA